MVPCSVKAKGSALENFSLSGVVAVCDHLGLLFGCQLEQKVAGEAVAIALDLLVEPLGGHAVERGQVDIDCHAQPAHGADA